MLEYVPKSTRTRNDDATVNLSYEEGIASWGEYRFSEVSAHSSGGENWGKQGKRVSRFLLSKASEYHSLNETGVL